MHYLGAGQGQLVADQAGDLVGRLADEISGTRATHGIGHDQQLLTPCELVMPGAHQVKHGRVTPAARATLFPTVRPNRARRLIMIDELGPAPAALLVSAVRDRRGMRLVVAGDVDVISAWQFREYLAGALDTTPASLTVDLGGVTFLDSTGLSALVYAHQRARHEGVPSWWPIRNRRYAGSSMSPAC
ncbi:hypothetical protein Pflav_023800 [Phytohabitans flavus]|uniref:STAS domain-containing protein n=2 Tax=Phytohabitans flavus TaxID=1076124 RepID=A0A6F8XQ74_9ACTN|nr:hypothetical protein Pflav_023800 [Phytohabitans flavus]